MSDLPEGSVSLGTIKITYYLDSAGEPKVAIDRPDFDVIPALVQLGMVAFANYDVMGPGPDDA